MKPFLITAIILALGLSWSVIRTYILIQRTNKLIATTVPFERDIPNAGSKILILGDSTAFGTGASDNTKTTAGRLGEVFSEASVANLAQNGQKLEGLVKLLKEREEKNYYDIILIQIGANDIIRFTSLKKIKAELQEVLSETKALGDKVIVLHSGNVGEAAFFPWYIRPIYSYRSYKVRDIYKEVAAQYDARYVDIIDSDSGDKMKKDKKRYYANDYLHLSNDGYGLWFDEIKKQLK